MTFFQQPQKVYGIVLVVYLSKKKHAHNTAIQRLIIFKYGDTAGF